MMKSFFIAFSTAAAVTLSIASGANAFGLASATRNIAPKQNDAPPSQFQIFCLQNTGDCRRGRTNDDYENTIGTAPPFLVDIKYTV